MTEEQRREWLAGLKPGDRVQTMSDDPGEMRADGEPWSATVVKVYEGGIKIYDDEGGELEDFEMPSGSRSASHLFPDHHWYIQPLPPAEVAA